MIYTAIIEQDGDDWYIGTVPNLKGCRTQAKTLPELYERLEEVVALCEAETAPEEMQLRFIGVQNLSSPAHA